MGDLNRPVGGTALHLCVDMQRLFADEGPWSMPWMTRVLPLVEALVARAPERTVFTRFIPPVRGEEMPGMWRAYYRKWNNVTREKIDPALLELLPKLARFVPPARIFDKMVYSAFADGRLASTLAAEAADTLIVTGSETDVCVLSSVLAAVDHGFRVIVARDAVCSSSDEAHDALLDLYRKRFDLQIELAQTEEILERWQPG